ncbi:MAG: PqqD family protein [Thermoproteota archaeon]
MLSEDSIPLRGKAVAFRILGEETVIVNIDTGFYYTLNEVGTRIWQLLERGRSIKEIVRIVLEEYAVDEDKARKDVLEFINDLYKEGLVEIYKDPDQAS